MVSGLLSSKRQKIYYYFPRGVSSPKPGNGALYYPSKDEYCCLSPLHSLFSASFSFLVKWNKSDQPLWQVILFMVTLFCLVSDIRTHIWTDLYPNFKMPFFTIFNPKATVIAGLIALVVCQALCWAKCFTCVIFPNLFQNLIKQKPFPQKETEA